MWKLGLVFLLLSHSAMADVIFVADKNAKPHWGGIRLTSGEWLILRRVEIMERGMPQNALPTRKQLYDMSMTDMGIPNADDLSPAGSYAYKCVSPTSTKEESEPNCTLSYMERVALSDNWAGECRNGVPSPTFGEPPPAPHSIRFTKTYNVPDEMYQFVLHYDAKRVGDVCGLNRTPMLFP